MKVYIDLIFFLNPFFDFILLLSVSIILKRNTSIKDLIKGALLGGLSIIILFFKMNSFTLFIFKFIISFLMIIVTFKYRNLYYTLKNMIYLYTSSMILGGFLYFLNVQFSYKQEGLVFYHNGLSINFVFLIIFSPIIIYIYIRQAKELKYEYSNHYEVDIFLKNKKYRLKGFVDTGNKLIDPYFHKPIIIIDKNTFAIDNYILVPIHTIKEKSLLKCIKVDKIYIKGIGVKKDLLVGLSDVNLEGIDCILNQKLMEG